MTPEDFVADRVVTIGTAAGARVHMQKLPQDATFPAVRVQWIDDVVDQHLRGPQPPRSRVQVDAYVAEASSSDPWDDIRTLADAIHGDGLGDNASGLFGWRGELGSPAIRVENVELIFRGRPLYEGDEIRLLRIQQDYRVHWRAA